jgi:hypothetical protein
MKKLITVCAVLLAFLWSGASEAALITSSGDAALSGATVDGFSSYAIGDPASISDGTFTMTANGAAYVSVRDDFNGSYGIVGRSVVDYNKVGVEIAFASPMSAFGIHIGAADAGLDWTLEAFSPGGASLGSGAVTISASDNANGFFMGWSDASIGSVVLTPSAADTAIFDNLSYVAIPEPATLGLAGLAAGAMFFFRRFPRG